MGSWEESVRKFVLLGCILGGLCVIGTNEKATAQEQEYEFNVIEGDEIKNDPVAQKMLEKIEESKKILEALQNGGGAISLTEHQKFIEEQRKLVQAELQTELDRMNKRYEAYTPKNAFASYVADKPEYMQEFYWDQFNYLDNKISIAKKQRDQVLQNGGSFQQAQQVFIQYATFPKSEVNSVFNELVKKHDLYDHYAGEIDPDKWYPPEAVEMFESWSENDPQHEYVNDVNALEQKAIQSQITEQKSNETIQNISLESSFEMDETTSDVEAIETSTANVAESLNAHPNAMKLDGQNSYTIDGSILNKVSKFTASAWIKPNYDKGSSSFTILQKPGVFQLTVNNYVEPRHVVEFSVFDGIRWNTIKSFSEIDEEWTHVAGVLKDSSLSLYINGNQEAFYQIGGVVSLNSKGMIEKSQLQTNSSPEDINIGVQKVLKLDGDKTQNYFSGLIDEVLIHEEISIKEIHP